MDCASDQELIVFEKVQKCMRKRHVKMKKRDMQGYRTFSLGSPVRPAHKAGKWSPTPPCCQSLCDKFLLTTLQRAVCYQKELKRHKAQ